MSVVVEPVLIGGGVKRCPSCGVVRPLEGFARNRSRVDGRASACRSCEAERARRYRERDLEASRARNRECERRRRAENP